MINKINDEGKANYSKDELFNQLTSSLASAQKCHKVFGQHPDYEPTTPMAKTLLNQFKGMEPAFRFLNESYKEDNKSKYRP